MKVLSSKKNIKQTKQKTALHFAITRDITLNSMTYNLIECTIYIILSFKLTPPKVYCHWFFFLMVSWSSRIASKIKTFEKLCTNLLQQSSTAINNSTRWISIVLAALLSFRACHLTVGQCGEVLLLTVFIYTFMF